MTPLMSARPTGGRERSGRARHHSSDRSWRSTEVLTPGRTTAGAAVACRSGDQGRTAREPRGCPRSRSAPSASCTATSGPARSTRSARRSTIRSSTVDRSTAFGVASVVFWSLIIIISIKYLALVMRADNRGEGGILALTALVMPRSGVAAKGITAGVITLGVFGTSLLYGDGLITPAISVLSAVEGFEVATSAFEDWVLPITIAILVALFSVQKRGTGQDRRGVQPDHGRVVHGDRRARAASDPPPSVRAPGDLTDATASTCSSTIRGERSSPSARSSSW